MCVMFQSKINVMLYDAANSANNAQLGPGALSQFFFFPSLSQYLKILGGKQTAF